MGKIAFPEPLEVSVCDMAAAYSESNNAIRQRGEGGGMCSLGDSYQFTPENKSSFCGGHIIYTFTMGNYKLQHLECN